jgi:hypothetical protein
MANISQINGLLINAATASLATTASYAVTASFAPNYVLNSATSSFVTNTQTGSFATTGSNTFIGNQTITGSLTISGSDNVISIFSQASANAITVNNNGYLKFNASAISYIRGFSTSTLFAVYNSAFTNVFNIGTSAASYINTGTNFIIGTTTDIGGRLSVRGSGATSATTTLRVENTNASASFVVLDNGNVGIGTIAPTASLHISTSNTSSAYSFLVQNSLGQTLIGIQNDRTVNINSTNATNGNTTIGTTSGTITFNQGYNNVLAGNALTFYNGGAASTIQGWFTNPGIGIGYTQTNTQPNPGTALAIRGTTTTSGSGVLFVTGSSTTRLLRIASETNADILTVSGSGTVGISNNGVVNTALAITANGSGGGNYIVQGYDAGSVNRFLVTATGRLQMTGTTDTGTSGTDERVRLTNTFNPTSGTREHMGIYLVQAISQSGGANGITRGLYIQPTLTAATDYRAIETTGGGVHINTTSVAASSVLQADSTTKGFLPPRMTNTQRLAIATPAVGLMVYCTDAIEGLYINKSTGWTFIA